MLKLDGPLKEILKIYDPENQDEFDRIKTFFYVYLYKRPKGDTTRVIRQIINDIYKKDSKKFNTLLSEAERDYEIITSGAETSTEAKESHNEIEVNPKSDENIINSETESLLETVTNINDSVLNEKALNKPITTLEKVLKDLSSVDKDIVQSRKQQEQTVNYKKLLNEIKTKVEGLEKYVS